MKISGLLSLAAVSVAIPLATEVDVESMPISIVSIQSSQEDDETIGKDRKLPKLIRVEHFDPEIVQTVQEHFKPCHRSKKYKETIQNEDELSYFDKTLNMLNNFFNGEQEHHELDEMRKHRGPKHHRGGNPHGKHHRGPPPPPEGHHGPEDGKGHHRGPPPPPEGHHGPEDGNGHHRGPPPPPEGHHGPEDGKGHHKGPYISPEDSDDMLTSDSRFRTNSKSESHEQSEFEEEEESLKTYIDIESIHEHFRSAFGSYDSEEFQFQEQIDPTVEICKGFLGGFGLLVVVGGVFSIMKYIKRRRATTNVEYYKLEDEEEANLPEYSEKDSEKA